MHTVYSHSEEGIRTFLETVSSFVLPKEEMVSNFRRRKDALRRFSCDLPVLRVVRYAVLSERRIDFPRPPGHRCASRFSLPDGRDKRGAASKFARFIRHRRRFAHFHWSAPPFIKAAVGASFVLSQGTRQAFLYDTRSCRRVGGTLQCQFSDGKYRIVNGVRNNKSD